MNASFQTSEQISAKDMALVQKRLAQAIRPECSKCRKPGSDCRNRETCHARWLKLALQGCDRKALHGVALSYPPDAWIVARRYGHYGAQGVTRSRVKLYNTTDHAAMRQHYAYDLAMGVNCDAEVEIAA